MLPILHLSINSLQRNLVRHGFFVNQVVGLIKHVKKLVYLPHPLVQKPIRAARIRVEANHAARSVDLRAHLFGTHQIRQPLFCFHGIETKQLAKTNQGDVLVVRPHDKQVVLDDSLSQILFPRVPLFAAENFGFAGHLARERLRERVPVDDFLCGELLGELLMQGKVIQLRVGCDLVQQVLLHRAVRAEHHEPNRFLHRWRPLRDVADHDLARHHVAVATAHLQVIAFVAVEPDHEVVVVQFQLRDGWNRGIREFEVPLRVVHVCVFRLLRLGLFLDTHRRRRVQIHLPHVLPRLTRRFHGGFLIRLYDFVE
mmetsp:Transcript_6573/g.22107  ORF Transcript_6573/g.22107 Transcript_6573/m.22107 type:complete len:312 (-) Transcript_6573:675-1610(-)